MTDTEGLAPPPAEQTSTPSESPIVDIDALPEVEQDDSEGDQGKAKTEAGGDAGEKDEAERKKLSGAQRAKIREQRLLDQLAERDRELQEFRARTEAPAGKAGDGEAPPKESDFDDWFAYQRAVSAFESRHVAREEARKALEARDQNERVRRDTHERRQRDLDHADRVGDARDTIADFDNVMEKMKGVNVRTDVIEEIKSSDKSALITYHLAQNPHELEALNQMSPKELARAMGRLEATLKLPEPKKQTSAPPPASSPRGGASPPSQEAELAAWLKKKYG